MPRKWIFVLLIGVMGFLHVGPASAETILLKDGSRMTGTIVSAGADSIQFQTPDGVLTIRRERIQSIDYGSAPTPPAPNAAQTAPPQAPEATQSAPAPVKADEAEHKASFQFVLEPGFRFSNSEADGGFSGNVAALSRVSPTISVGGSVGIAHFNNKVKTLSKGNVTVIPLMARAVARTRDGLSFAAGLGYAFTDHGLDSDVESALAQLGLSLKEDVQPTFVAEMAFGYMSAPQTTISGGVFFGYQIHEPDVDITLTDLASGGDATVGTDVSFSAPFVRAFLSF